MLVLKIKDGDYIYIDDLPVRVVIDKYQVGGEDVVEVDFEISEEHEEPEQKKPRLRGFDKTL